MQLISGFGSGRGLIKNELIWKLHPIEGRSRFRFATMETVVVLLLWKAFRGIDMRHESRGDHWVHVLNAKLIHEVILIER